jgi:hypothetical protein
MPLFGRHDVLSSVRPKHDLHWAIILSFLHGNCRSFIVFAVVVSFKWPLVDQNIVFKENVTK